MSDYGSYENECLILGFLSEEEPKKVEEALMDPDWMIAKQDELNRIKRPMTLKLIPRTKDLNCYWHLIGYSERSWMKMTLLRGTKSYWFAEGYSQEEVSSIQHICTSSKT